MRSSRIIFAILYFDLGLTYVELVLLAFVTKVTLSMIIVLFLANLFISMLFAFILDDLEQIKENLKKEDKKQDK
ncbi:hypothetical protein [Sulfolobus spindle-shaped virus]|nr:hypothetical protein [Sulfolobus spindle-shaped virus]